MSHEENIPTETELAKRKEIIIAFLERFIRLDTKTAEELSDLLYERSHFCDLDISSEELEEIDDLIVEIFVGDPQRIQEMNLDDEAPITPELQSWMNQVSSQIINLRKTKNWTISDLAQQSNIPVDYLNEVEQGSLPPSHVVLEKIASVFNIPVSTFDPTF